MSQRSSAGQASPLRSTGLALPIALLLSVPAAAAPPGSPGAHPSTQGTAPPANRWGPPRQPSSPAVPSSPASPPVPRWAPLPQRPVPPPSAAPPLAPAAPPAEPAVPPAENPALPQVPLYRLTGYEQRQEVPNDADWRRLLGPQRYRQEVAGRWLKLIGGGAAFAGAISLLVGLGNLANQTDWGRKPAESHQPDFEAFVIGFGSMTAVGGAALLTGVMLSWSLPDRVRPIYLPQLQRDGQPAAPATPPARSAPVSSFPTWAWAAPASPAWIQ